MQVTTDSGIEMAVGGVGLEVRHHLDLLLGEKIAHEIERRPSDEAMAEMLKTERMTSLFGLPT